MEETEENTRDTVLQGFVDSLLGAVLYEPSHAEYLRECYLDVFEDEIDRKLVRFALHLPEGEHVDPLEVLQLVGVKHAERAKYLLEGGYGAALPNFPRLCAAIRHLRAEIQADAMVRQHINRLKPRGKAGKSLFHLIANHHEADPPVTAP